MAKKIKTDTEGLTITLAPGQGAGVSVAMEVFNPTSARKIFCTYHTPFEGIRNEIFAIRDGNGDEVSYAGMMAKRAAPGPEDYITLAPNDAQSAEVDLTDGYDLAPGDYTVTFPGNMISGLDASNPVTISVA